MTQQPVLSIILPTFNEAENIVKLIKSIQSTVYPKKEIIVVDDNSPDGTWKRVQDYAESNPDVKLIRRLNESGLTSAIQKGIDQANGQYIGWLDCDLSMPPEKFNLFFETLLSGCEIAVGSRYVKGGADLRAEKLHVILSKVICEVCRVSLKRDFHDYTSGFILAKADLFKHVRLNGDYGEYFIDLIWRAHRLGFRIKEIPYQFTSRTWGESKTATNPLGFLKRGPKYLAQIARCRLGL